MSEKSIVIIKSFKNGLRLIFDEQADFEDILRELGKKCSDGRSFFGNATMAISVEGRKLSEIEEIRVIETIRINCNLNVICIIDHDEDMNYRFIKALGSLENRLKDEDKGPGHFFRGSLTDGEKLEVDYPVVILGDVNPGCRVVSKEGIIVLGGLYGEAVVTAESKDDSGDNNAAPFIIALELAAERLVINDVEFVPAVKPKWGFKHKIQPQIAYVKENEVIIETVSKSVLETLYAI